MPNYNPNAGTPFNNNNTMNPAALAAAGMASPLAAASANIGPGGMMGNMMNFTANNAMNVGAGGNANPFSAEALAGLMSPGGGNMAAAAAAPAGVGAGGGMGGFSQGGPRPLMQGAATAAAPAGPTSAMSPPGNHFPSGGGGGGQASLPSLGNSPGGPGRANSMGVSGAQSPYKPSPGSSGMLLEGVGMMSPVRQSGSNIGLNVPGGAQGGFFGAGNAMPGGLQLGSAASMSAASSSSSWMTSPVGAGRPPAYPNVGGNPLAGVGMPGSGNEPPGLVSNFDMPVTSSQLAGLGGFTQFGGNVGGNAPGGSSSFGGIRDMAGMGNMLGQGMGRAGSAPAPSAAGPNLGGGLGLGLGQGQQGGFGGGNIGDLGAFLSAQQMGGSPLADNMMRLLTPQASTAQ